MTWRVVIEGSWSPPQRQRLDARAISPDPADPTETEKEGDNVFLDSFLMGAEGARFRTFPMLDINPLGGSFKWREISAPNRAMRIIHKRLNKWLRARRPHLPYVTGCKLGCSPRRNVLNHSMNRWFYLTDIHAAYPSVKGQKLAQVLCNLDKRLHGQEEAVLEFLKKYCLTPDGGLVTGAPASPELFNIYCSALIDEPLGELCRKYGLRYTRYLDDCTFSAKKVRIGHKKRRALRQVIMAAGFEIAHHKSKVYDLRKGPITINGVGLEFGGRIFTPRKYLRRINALIYLRSTGRDISIHRIYGTMGVFKATCGVTYNRTEANLVSRYHQMRLREGLRC